MQRLLDLAARMNPLAAVVPVPDVGRRLVAYDRKGHWVMFIIGIFIPLFWIIGALLPAKQPD